MSVIFTLSSFVQDESENVEKLGVSATEAFNKFKDKNLDGNKADFSDRLRRGRNVSLGQSKCQPGALCSEVLMISLCTEFSQVTPYA